MSGVSERQVPTVLYATDPGYSKPSRTGTFISLFKKRSALKKKILADYKTTAKQMIADLKLKENVTWPDNVPTDLSNQRLKDFIVEKHECREEIFFPLFLLLCAYERACAQI